MRVLYLVYWGALEQLGQALVVPSVTKLSQAGARITLITFEKPADLERSEEVAQMRSKMHAAGVDWHPLRYHKRSRVFSMALDTGQGVVTGTRMAARMRFDIIHARSFQAGLMGMLLAPMLKAHLIYHNEGFYPDEQVDAGVWLKHSWQHRSARWLEAAMYERSNAVFALSERSLARVGRFNPRVSVVPSAIDVDGFPNPGPAPGSRNEVTYLGSVGGRYDLPQVAAFVACARTVDPAVTLRVISQSPASLVGDAVSAGGLTADAWRLESLRPDQVPSRLGGGVAGIHFLRPGIASHAGSPTKIGEYWAAGLPVVMTPEMGDIGEIAERERVGVVTRDTRRVGYLEVYSRLRQLLLDPADLRARCQRVARAHYGLDEAVRAQVSVYKTLSDDVRLPR